MSNKCRIEKKGGEYNIRPLIREIRKLISDAKLESTNRESGKIDQELLRKKLKQMLYVLGDKYYSNQLNIVEKALNESLKKEQPVFKNYFPRNIMSYMRQSTRSEAERIDKETYEASESPGNPAFEGESYFLDLKFGFDTNLKEQIKRNVSNNLLNSFIINRDRTNQESGFIVQTIEDANENIRQYKQRLFDIILDYIKSTNGNVSQIKLFEGSEFVGNFDSNLLEILDGLRATPQNKLLNLYNESKKESKEKNKEIIKKELEAVQALFILDNFDNFVKLLMGGVIDVKPGTANKLVSGNNYRFSDKGGHVIISWRTDDNISMEAEISALAQTLVNSTSFFNFGTNNPSAQYIKFEDFYRIVTKIKDLALNEDLAKVITGNERWFRENLSKQEQDSVKGKSLRNIITNIRMNPQIYTRVAFTALCNLGKNVDESKSELKKLGFNEEEQDKLWSIYKGFFDSSDPFSIKGIQDSYEYTQVKNYYEIATQTVDSMFSVDYMNYSEDGNIITVGSLKDSDLEKTRYEIQGNILQSNSRNIIKNGFEDTHMKPFNAEPLYETVTETKNKQTVTKEVLSGITIKPIPGSNFTITWNFRNEPKGFVTNMDITTLIDSDSTIPFELRQFIDTQLNLDLKYDNDYYDKLITIFNGDVGNVVTTLLKLSSKVLFNKYISNVLFSGKNEITGKTNSLKELKKIYGNKSELIPRYNAVLMEIDLLAQTDAMDLRKLARARLLSTGQAQSSSVKDAEGNLLSTQTLSRQLGNMAFQHDEILDKSKRFIRTLFELDNDKTYTSKSGDTYNLETGINAVEIVMNGNQIQSINVNVRAIEQQYNTLDPNFKLNFFNVDEYATYLVEYGIATKGTFDNAVISNRVIRSLNYRKNAASGFSLLKPGFYTGFYTEKEFKGSTNKARTEFTPAEAMQASFLYSFVGGLLPDTEGIVGKGNIGLLPSVNSDKNTMGEAIFNLQKNLKDTGRTWYDIVKSTDSKDMELLENAICEELGEAYQISLNNIKSDFLELISWLQENKQLLLDKYKDSTVALINRIIPEGNVIINPETDFKELNAFANGIGYKTSDLLFEWTKLYNNNNVNSIKLIDQTHFINAGNTIKFNNTFKRLLERYKDPTKFHRFMEMKRSELLVSLLNENFSINLQGDVEDTTKQTPKKYLSTFEGWINTGNQISSIELTINGIRTKLYGNNVESLYNRAKEKGYTDSFEEFQKEFKRNSKNNSRIASVRGKMILAKVTVNGKTIDIINKDDLKHVRNLVEGRPNFLANPHELFNPKYGLKVELHPMLDKYNTMDYFLSQEYMISGVGTHTNHLSKVKYKTPIIWGHPAIGKTYVMQNSSYKNQIIDWDEEFNLNRDNWIAAATGTTKGTPEFKAIRNEYMIHYDKHPDYVKFVESEWKRIKNLANSQNKILVASPHMLLDLFPEDFNKILTMGVTDFEQRAIKRGDSNYSDWKIGIDLSLAPFKGSDKLIEIKPGETLESMLNNGQLYDELQQLLENDIQEEAARFLAQHKRNVSYTAAMYPFQLNQITGIPTMYNMAIIDDIKSSVYTITGDYDSHKPFDGATFVNPLVMYWENNSLQENRAGIDKKQFIHFYDHKTGTGGIVKTAGFAITNNRAKKDKFYRDMAYNMMNRKWKNQDGSQHISDTGIFVDFLGNDVIYQDIFFEKDGKYYHRKINEYLGNNTYSVTDTEVDIHGEFIEDVESIPTNITVESNYDVWQLLGGYNSQEIINNVLQSSEISLKRTADLANSYGQVNSDILEKIKQNPDNKKLVKTAEDLYQPMKHSDIHYMPTVGAIKQGGGNINPSSYFYGHHELNFMQVQMTQAGIQLDKEHHADNSVLSLMTQVISAACSRGYTKDHALKLYKALEQLTKLGTKEFRNELGDLIVGDTEKFNEAVSNILLQTILTSKSNDDDMLQIVAKDIIREAMTNKSFSFDKNTLSKFDKTVPYSDNPVFNKIVSSLTVSLTKSGIKTKMPGILSVLCPTQDIIKFYKIPVLDSEGNPTGQYKRVSFGQVEKELHISGDQLDAKLDELQQNEKLLQTENGNIDYSQIEVGYKYLVKYTDGTYKVVHVGGPHRFDKSIDLGLRESVDKNGNPITIPAVITGYKNLKEDSNIESIQEWIKEGQDLRAFNVKFKAGDIEYQMYDLDIVQDYFEIKQSDTPFETMVSKLKEHGCFDELIDRVNKELSSTYRSNNLFEEDQTVLQSEAEILDQYDALKEANDPSADNIDTTNFGKYRARRSFNDSYNFLQELIRDLSTTGTLHSENDYESTQQKAIVKQFNKYVKAMAIKGMNRQLQLTLDGISPSSYKTRVKINGNYVNVDPNSIVKKCYGAIMPKTFKSNFGLDQFDQVEDIKADPDFFVKKLAEKLFTKVEGYTKVITDGDIKRQVTVNNFHLELKRPDGNHIYIRKGNSSSNNGKIISGLKEEVAIITIKESDGTIYRVDGNKKKMYQLFSENDKVYKDMDGNEVIVTSDITEYQNESGKVIDPSLYEVKDTDVIHKETGEKLKPVLRSGLRFYLDNLDYTTFNISEHCSDDEFEHVLLQAANSSNEDSKHLATKIEKIKRKSKLTNARKYVNKLNDYSALIDSSGNFKSGIDPDIERRIKSLGRKMHTSFLQSLNIIAARIPAQSQQSFMPMEIEAFEDPDVNTAYVSTFQFYLQGSDLDIDAVSLQTFDIDQNGLLVGHSPYYNLNDQKLRKASEDLPFPTGETTELITSETNNETFIEKYRYLFGDLIKLEYNLNDGIRVTFDTNSTEHIRILSELIEEVNSNKGILIHQNLSEDRLDALAVALSRIYPEEQYDGPGKFRLENIEKALQKAFDRHDLYVQKANVNKRQFIIRNYITTQLFNISSDPINLIESQSSVDTMTSTAKDLAKLSPKATVQNHFTPGNVMNKFQSISENMVGKDGIAICATGLKSFFAITEMYQQILNVDINSMQLTELEKQSLTSNLTDPEEIQKVLDEALKQKKAKALAKKQSLLFKRSIAGKTYLGLANGYTELMLSSYEANMSENDMQSQYENFTQMGYEYLLDQLWSSDAANEMSALLSLSTDNAKELVLAKINAGIGTIGMYLYGLSIGMSFDSIYDIMTSPLAFRLAELTKGDVFNKQEGQRDILSTMQYLRREPTQQIDSILGRAPVIFGEKYNGKAEINKILKNVIDTLFSEHKDVIAWNKYKQEKKKGDGKKAPFNPYANPITFIVNNIILKPKSDSNSKEKVKEVTIYDVKQVLDRNRPVKITLTELEKMDENDKSKVSHYKSVINQTIDFIQQYIDDASLLHSRPKYYNIYGRQDLVSDIEQLAMGALEMKEMGKILRLNQEIKTNSADLIKQVANIEEAITRRLKVLKQKYPKSKYDKFKEDFKDELSTKQINAALKMLDDKDYEENYKVDIERFLTDEAYREKCIEQYNIVKQSYNPLQVIAEVPHYRGYVESMYIAYKGLKNKSVKFRVLSEYTKDWIKSHGVSAALQPQVVKNASDAVNVYLRQEWMKSAGIRFIIPKGAHAFTTDLINAKELKVNKPIQLGTDVGDANFKLWMEEIIIPKLKQELPNNKFIQNLKPAVNSSTNRGTVGISYTLPINMMPKSDYEKSTFNEYMYYFNELGVIKINGEPHDVRDLLYLYSLITTNGKMGPKSLHKIFNNYIETKGPGSLPYSYREFINSKDSDPNTYREVVQFLGDGYMIAPITTPTGGGGTVIRYRDLETGNMLLLGVPKKQDSEQGYEDEESQIYGLDADLFEEGQDEVTIAEDGQSEPKPVNYGKYKLLKIDLIGGKANPIYFQNAIDTRKSKIGERVQIYGDFRIKLSGDGTISNIDGLTDEAKKYIPELLNIANRNQKIELRIQDDKRQITVKEGLPAVLKAIDKINKKC